ncbi:MAG: serine/threonine-protein phosphatase [Clostridiales bacterium]|nr:serine/threonine-protein phosphatase [Clostridiales bacterium]
MIWNGLYKKILEGLPSGVFAFDDKLKVKYTNTAFRRSFSEKAKKKGTLAEALACAEKGKCGETENCKFCAFRRVMLQAVEEKKEKSETLRARVKRNGRTDVVSLQIRVFPLGENGKLFLGLTDGIYQTEMEREMLSAGQMQRRLLPAGKIAGGVPYSYTYIPCLEVGGDLPDVYELNGQTYGVLTDVSGKGVSAGMLSAFVKAGFDRTQTSLATALDKLNEKFSELNQDERSYITVASVRIDETTKTLRYAIAGHNAPILLKNSFGIHEIEMPSPPISNWFADTKYQERELPFEKGDLLVLLTDGVTECANSAGELFGIERAESVLTQSRNAEDFIGKLKNALTVFCGGKFTDDVTAIAFDL